jgi:hypothetical protein
MAGSNPLTEMRRICLALPEATETMTWGSRTSGYGGRSSPASEITPASRTSDSSSSGSTRTR